jgi:hypothetical protein
MTVTDIDLNEQILAGSVLTTGLGGDDLKQDGSGNSWNEVLSRGSNVWFDEAEENW